MEGPVDRPQHHAFNGQHGQKRQRCRQGNRRSQQPPCEPRADQLARMRLDQMTQARPEDQRRDEGRRHQSDLDRDIDVEQRCLEPGQDFAETALHRFERQEFVESGIILCHGPCCSGSCGEIKGLARDTRTGPEARRNGRRFQPLHAM
jgi:hypothetical protein